MTSKTVCMCACFWAGILFAFVQFPKESVSQKRSAITDPRKRGQLLSLRFALGPIWVGIRDFYLPGGVSREVGLGTHSDDYGSMRRQEMIPV